jgi:hypothetical protein
MMASFDKTWAMLQELAHNDDRIVAVDLSRNHGFTNLRYRLDYRSRAASVFW